MPFNVLRLLTLRPQVWSSLFFFFNDTATTEIYTLSLHDALPIFADNFGFWPYDKHLPCGRRPQKALTICLQGRRGRNTGRDRKSTRLNSSHLVISYAVFCLKKKKRTRYSPALSIAAPANLQPHVR